MRTLRGIAALNGRRAPRLGSTEGAYFLATGQLRSLSEQQLVDCASGAAPHSTGNNGCKGGVMEKGYEYIIKNGGIDSEADYNYTAKVGTAPGWLRNWANCSFF